MSAIPSGRRDWSDWGESIEEVVGAWAGVRGTESLSESFKVIFRNEIVVEIGQK